MAHVWIYALGWNSPNIHGFSGRIVSNSHRCREGEDLTRQKTMDLEPPSMVKSSLMTTMKLLKLAHGQYLDDFGSGQSHPNLSQFWVTVWPSYETATSGIIPAPLNSVQVETEGILTADIIRQHLGARERKRPSVTTYELSLKLSIVPSFQAGKQTMMSWPKPRSSVSKLPFLAENNADPLSNVARKCNMQWLSIYFLAMIVTISIYPFIHLFNGYPPTISQRALHRCRNCPWNRSAAETAWGGSSQSQVGRRTEGGLVFGWFNISSWEIPRKTWENHGTMHYKNGRII